MPPHPSHRLSAWLVPTEPDRACPFDTPGRLQRLQTSGSGPEPGPPGEALIPGGWVGVRLDRPPGPHLYGNKQGGYRIRCPSCAAPLIAEATDALERWRGGGDRALVCRRCQQPHSLEGLDYRPAAAPARFAIELRDIQGLDLTAAGAAHFSTLLGGDFLVIASRG